MAAKSTALCTSILKLLYQAVAIANVADNATSSPITNVYYNLHTDTPGAGGTQSTNQISYTGYARQAVARTAGGHSVSSGVCNPVANILFPQSSSGTPTATHFSTGTDSSGAGNLWHYGAVSPNIIISTTSTNPLLNTTAITES